MEPRLRAALLTGMVLLEFCCNFRTLDPLSKRITGTIQFGTHPLLAIESLRSRDDTNKDVLVYNLEHTQLGYLLDDAFAAIRPTSGTVFVRDPDAWRLYERVDAKTCRRTETHGPSTIQLTHFKPEELLAMEPPPEEIYLIELPYFHNAKNEATLAPFYGTTRRLTFSRGGYEMSVLQMARKAGPDRVVRPN